MSELNSEQLVFQGTVLDRRDAYPLSNCSKSELSVTKAWVLGNEENANTIKQQSSCHNGLLFQTESTNRRALTTLVIDL